MKIYWNTEYCAPEIDFETFRKSRLIAEVLPVVLRDAISLVDPANVGGCLAQAYVALRDGVDAEYLSAIMTGNPRGLAESNGLGWDEGIYPMVLNSTAGIIAATDSVLSGDKASCSLSSGLHHARHRRGGGFCTVNSLALGALYAANKGKKVVILDLDAHCGGGTAEYIEDTSVKQVDFSISNFDAYESDDNSQLFIIPKEGERIYGEFVGDALNAVEKIGPDVVFYNAGVDVFPTLKPTQVVEREVDVATRLNKLGVGTVLVMAGGYGDDADIIPLHIATIGAFAAPTPDYAHKAMVDAQKVVTQIAVGSTC